MSSVPWVSLHLYGLAVLVFGLVHGVFGNPDSAVEPIVIEILGGLAAFFGLCGISASEKNEEDN